MSSPSASQGRQRRPGTRSSNNGKPFRRHNRGPNNNNISNNSNSRDRQLRPTGTWKRSFTTNNDNDAGDDSDVDDVERCIICTDKIVFAAISDCNHVTCHVCTFRHRALFQKRSCIVCRTENMKNSVMSETTDRNFDEFSAADIASTSEEYAIDFTSESAREATLGLLKNKCGFQDCGQEFPTFKKLSAHVKNDHERFYCLLCSAHKKAFPCELRIYTHGQLKRHQREGDAGNSGFKGHPRCGFCSHEMFYSEDELNVHLRERHEKCHVCEQIDSSNPRYFKNYEELAVHFNSEHYVCPVQSCLDQKFVAFADEISLKAHMISDHKNLIGNDRTLHSIGTTHGPFRTATNRRFQSSLSTFRSDAHEEQDSYDTKKLRFEERARHYLSYSQEDFDKFQGINRDFLKNNKLSPQELLFEYKELFSEQSVNDISLLIHEILELIPKNQTSKKKDLQEFSDEYFKELKNQESFPVLGEPSTSLSNSNSASSSTNSMKRTGERAIWAAKPNNAPSQRRGNISNPFPSLSQSFGSNSANSSSSNLSSSSRWGSSNAKTINSNDEAFPALSAPKTRPPVLNNTVQYRTLKSKKKSTAGSSSSLSSAAGSRSLSPSLTASQLNQLHLNDSSASWASPSSSKQKLPAGSSKAKVNSNNEEFPSLPVDTTKAPKVNRTVRYTTLSSKKGSPGLTTGSSASRPGGNNIRIVRQKLSNSSSSLNITNHVSSESAEGTATPSSGWGKSALNNNEPSAATAPSSGNVSENDDGAALNGGKKKKKQKQILFQFGL